MAVGDAVASYDPISSSGIPRALATGVHGAFIAVDHLFSEGSLLDTYAQAIEQDFRQYLQTQWQYYQRETRWPDSVFWARRRAVIALSKDSMIQDVHFYENKITVQAAHVTLEAQNMPLVEQYLRVERIGDLLNISDYDGRPVGYFSTLSYTLAVTGQRWGFDGVL